MSMRYSVSCFRFKLVSLWLLVTLLHSQSNAFVLQSRQDLLTNATFNATVNGSVNIDLGLPLKPNERPPLSITAVSERLPTVEPARLLHTWLSILNQLWRERSDREITRDLKLREYTYETYTVKFSPRQGQILMSDAAWALVLIIENQFAAAALAWTRTWRVYDWQLSRGRTVIADIRCEPVHRQNPTSAPAGNYGTLAMNATDSSTNGTLSSGVGLTENRDITVDVRYLLGQILEFNLLLLLWYVIEYWMQVSARTLAYTLSPYDDVKNFDDRRGFRGVFRLLDPGPNLMVTKASDIVDGLLNVLVELDEDRLYEPFSATIYKPGRRPIAQIAIGGKIADMTSATSSIAEIS